MNVSPLPVGIGEGCRWRGSDLGGALDYLHRAGIDLEQLHTLSCPPTSSAGQPWAQGLQSKVSMCPSSALLARGEVRASGVQATGVPGPTPSGVGTHRRVATTMVRPLEAEQSRGRKSGNDLFLSQLLDVGFWFCFILRRGFAPEIVFWDA